MQTTLCRRSSIAYLLVTGFASLLCGADDQGSALKALKALTGRATRVVWVQDAGPTACVYVEKPTVLLMGMDSADGKGERAIIPTPRSVYKPMLTADGKRVVFHDKVDGKVYVVGFDGSGLRSVVDDLGIEDVWTDPEDGVTWVYGIRNEQRGGQQVGALKRFQLDKPGAGELVWDKTPLGHFQLSGDGLAGSGGSSNGQGIFRLPNDSFTAPTGGCWPSMCPDATERFWVFSGNHRWTNMYLPLEPGSRQFSGFSVNLAEAPASPAMSRSTIPAGAMIPGSSS
ncbi:MAG: hypothetical protein H0W72_08275 [Planctomycetes bacterium]|nr:hypothetical protein [Planctomycetota bacterium]